MTRLSDWLLRHKRLVMLAWLGVLIVGVLLSPVVTERMSTTFALPGHDGYHANLAITETYGTGGRDRPTVAVITLPPGTTVDSAGVRDSLRRSFDTVARDQPARVVSYASTGDRRFVGTDQRTTYGLVFPSEERENSDTDPDAALAAGLRAGLPPDTTVRVTGISQLTQHESGSGGAEVLTLTLIGALGALIVLALVFGSLLAFLPLLVSAVAIMTTIMLVGLQTLVTDVNLIVLYLVALIGLGVAIDYSLLLVTRWREELGRGHGDDEAIRRAMATAGRAVLLSGTTVAVGLLALIVLPVPFLRSVGYSGLLIPLVSVLVNITLLPVLLAVFGRRLDWPWKRRHREVASGRIWTAWARRVVRARWVAVVLSVAGLGVLAVFALDLQVGPAQASALTQAGPAYEGLVALRDAGVPPGTLTPIEVLVPAGTDPDAVRSRLVGLPDIWTAVAPDEPAWRRGGTALVLVEPTGEPGTEAGRAAIERVRAVVAGEFPGARVGGSGAESEDFTDAVYGSFPLLVVIISLLTFVLLARAFRSPLLAAKAVLVNLLSIGAVLGAIVIVWQLGHGAAALGGVGATGALDTYVPMFVFAFLFGLSMDYEVFLLVRMREAYDRLGSTDEAVVEGLGRTGRLVTSAALILFLAFASLAGAQDTVTKIFATGLGAGILLDATVVRSLLVPALVSMMGRWNWWLPAWAARLLLVRAPGPALVDTRPDPARR